MATRRERVVLELQDNFTTEMARAAAATALLNKELGGLSRESVETRQATRAIGRDVDGLGKTANRAEKDIDKLSGRLRILADVGAALGPGLVPIGAVALPALTGLAASLGFAAVGTGVLVAAFEGMGDALTDMNKAGLDPTTENLAKAQLSLEALSPAARDFTTQLGALMPALNDLQEMAAEGVLPGFADGLESALTRLPAVERLVTGFSTALGNIGDNLGRAIEDGKVDDFLAFLATEGPAALEDFGKILGQTGLGLANLWMAFSPLNNDFSDFLVDATADFESFTSQLSGSESFQEFVEYVRENGPQVADTLGAVASAAVQIVQAIAPIGGPSLQVVEALAEALGAIADSDLGTPIFGLVAALGALNLAARSFQAVSRATFSGPGATMLRGYASGLTLVSSAQERATMSASALAAAEAERAAVFRRSAVAAGGLAFALSGAAESTGLMNTATLGILGPWGAAGGLLLDLKAGSDNWADSIRGIYDAIESGDFEILDARLKDLRTRLEDLQSFDGPTDFLGDLKSSLTGGDLVSKAQAIPVLGSFINLAFDGESPQEQATKAIKDGQAAMDASAGSVRSFGASWKALSTDVQKAAKDLKGVRDEAGKNAAQFLGFDKTLNESSISLDTWITHLNKQATALKDFASNAETATRRGLADGLIQQLSEAGPDGALRLKQLADASDTEIARANRAFRRGEEGVKQLKDVADGLEPIVVVAETDEATRKLRILKDLLIDIGAVPKATGRTSGGGNADLLRPGYADGGYTGPGGLNEPAGIVHRGEFVFSAAATSGNEALLADMHHRMRGYSDGGLVQPFRPYAAVSGGAPSPGGPVIDYDRLAVSLGQIRPLYGDVYMQPHNWSEVKRDMEADRRRAGLDGIQR